MYLAPFFYNDIFMNNDNKKNKRPYKMIGVAFPSAKYGLIFAIIVIAIVLILELLKFF